MNRSILAFALTLVIASPALGQVPPYLTSWGSYGTGDDQFYTPVGVAVDADGIVYVIDSNLRRVKRFTRTGEFLSQWSVYNCAGIALGPDGNVYVTQNNSVLKFTKSGTLLTAWDSEYTATGIAVDTDGSVYVASPDNVLEKYSGSGVLIQQWGEPAGGPQQFSGLDGVAVDGMGHVYTAENYNCRVQKFSTDGTYITQWGINGHGPGQFYIPVRLATSADGQWVYVDDYGNSRIEVFTNTGTYLGQLGSEGSGPGQFLSPIGIAVDRLGNVFVADTNNSRIQVFGDKPTPTQPISWAALKRRYR